MKDKSLAIFQVPIVVMEQVPFFRDITLCSEVEQSWRFDWPLCLHLQDWAQYNRASSSSPSKGFPVVVSNFEHLERPQCNCPNTGTEAQTLLSVQPTSLCPVFVSLLVTSTVSCVNNLLKSTNCKGTADPQTNLALSGDFMKMRTREGIWRMINVKRTYSCVRTKGNLYDLYINWICQPTEIIL